MEYLPEGINFRQVLGGKGGSNDILRKVLE